MPERNQTFGSRLGRYAALAARPLVVVAEIFYRFVDGCEKMDAMGEIAKVKYLLEHRYQYRTHLPEIPANPFSIYRFAKKTPIGLKI